MKRILPSVDIINSVISVSESTGTATWNNNGKLAGARYTTRQGKTYRQIKILGVVYPLHRVISKVFGILTDESLQVDHINGDGLDNRISNLRVVTQKENNRNRRIPSINTSGVIGVNIVSGTGKWQARIGTGSGRKHLGYFDDFDDAVKARRNAEIELGYSDGHGDCRPL